jgi:hypothetical protein
MLIRYVTVAVVACVYIGLSVWLVGAQGRAYRESLRQGQGAAVSAEEPAAPRRTSQPAPAPADPEIKTSRPEEAPAPAASPPKTAERPRDQGQRRKGAGGGGQPKRKVADVAKREPDTPPAKAAAPKAAIPADPLADNPIWNQPEVTKEWDLEILTAADESKLGAQLHELIVSLNPLAEDGPLQQRVEDAAKPFLDSRSRKDIRYTFEVLESSEVNAFSHPGGYVYVNRGLFDLIGEDEDYALQFAVGNEIAHVDLRHSIKCLQDPDVKRMSGGTIRKLYWLIIPFGYLVSDGVNQDFEADDWTFSRMRNFGRSKRESLAFLYKMEGYANRHGFGSGRGRVRLAADNASLLDIHYRRQTAARLRLQHLKEKIK